MNIIISLLVPGRGVTTRPVPHAKCTPQVSVESSHFRHVREPHPQEPVHRPRSGRGGGHGRGSYGDRDSAGLNSSILGSLSLVSKDP